MNPLLIWQFVTKHLSLIAIGVLVVALGISHWQLDSCHTKYKSHLVDDAKAALEAEENARKTESRNAEIAANINVLTLERNDAINKASAAARDLAHTRGLFVRVNPPRCDVPGTAADTGVGESGTIEARLSAVDGGFLSTFAADCARDQGVARDGHDWAIKIGQ